MILLLSCFVFLFCQFFFPLVLPSFFVQHVSYFLVLVDCSFALFCSSYGTVHKALKNKNTARPSPSRSFLLKMTPLIWRKKSISFQSVMINMLWVTKEPGRKLGIYGFVFLWCLPITGLLHFLLFIHTCLHSSIRECLRLSAWLSIFSILLLYLICVPGCLVASLGSFCFLILMEYQHSVCDLMFVSLFASLFSSFSFSPSFSDCDGVLWSWLRERLDVHHAADPHRRSNRHHHEADAVRTAISAQQEKDTSRYKKWKHPAESERRMQAGYEDEEEEDGSVLKCFLFRSLFPLWLPLFLFPWMTVFVLFSWFWSFGSTHQHDVQEANCHWNPIVSSSFDLCVCLCFCCVRVSMSVGPLPSSQAGGTRQAARARAKPERIRARREREAYYSLSLSVCLCLLVLLFYLLFFFFACCAYFVLYLPPYPSIPFHSDLCSSLFFVPFFSLFFYLPLSFVL